LRGLREVKCAGTPLAWECRTTYEVMLAACRQNKKLLANHAGQPQGSV